jgi:phosphoglucosamine mutase
VSARLFGTDGVRGRANLEPMTAQTALHLGAAIGARLHAAGKGGGRVLVGKDTRLSGYMIEAALTAGLTSMGMHALLVGPMPTPAVSFLTRALRCEAGLMISASHNPAEDNGIKVFDWEGAKVSDAEEDAIAHLVQHPAPLPDAPRIGRAKRIDDARGRYVERLKARVPEGVRFHGLRVVLDCANGAAYKIAPEVLWELGAEVIAIGVAPNGTNINAGCGSTHPEAAQAKVLETRADIGICLDGDADRVVLIDRMGRIVDGDQILAVLAQDRQARGDLNGPVVGTVMSNVALETHLQTLGIALERAPVGDRHIAARMRATGAELGGEPSGHLILGAKGATGDGLLAALQILAALGADGRPSDVFLHRFEPAPQIHRNIPIPRGSKPHEQPTVVAAVRGWTERLATSGGRVLVRPSGTEPLVRVMVEGPDRALAQEAADALAEAIRGAGA